MATKTTGFALVKLTTVILLSTLFARCGGWSRTKGNAYSENVPVQKVFQEVIYQTGMSIVYNDAYFRDVKPISIEVKDESANAVIKQCLAGLPFAISEDGRSITIDPNPRLETRG